MLDRDTLAKIYLGCQRVLSDAEFPPPNPYPNLLSTIPFDAGAPLMGIYPGKYTINIRLAHFETPDGEEADLSLYGRRPLGILPHGWSEAVWEASDDLGDKIRFQVTYHSTDPGNTAEKIAQSDAPLAITFGKTGPMLETQLVFFLKPTGEITRNTTLFYPGDTNLIPPMLRQTVSVHPQFPDVLSIGAKSLQEITDHDLTLIRSGISALRNRLTIDD